MEKKVFRNSGYPTSYFSGKIWVKCPKCNGIGFVSTILGKYIVPRPLNTNSKFICYECGTRNQVKGIADSSLYQGVVDKKCSNCKINIFTITQPKLVQDLYPFESLKCRNCKISNDYQLNWYRYRIENPIDPYFNLELILQTTIKSNLLWFYNIEHLSYIKEYIESDLREDNGRHKYSLISNLPKFIILAKNRELILSKMNKLISEFKQNEKFDT